MISDKDRALTVNSLLETINTGVDALLKPKRIKLDKRIKNSYDIAISATLHLFLLEITKASAKDASNARDAG